MKKFIHLLMLSVGLLLFACGKDISEPGKQSTATDSVPVKPSVDTPKVPGQIVDTTAQYPVGFSSTIRGKVGGVTEQIGVTINLLNLGTNVNLAVVVTANSAFDFNGLGAGQYQVTASAKNYKTSAPIPVVISGSSKVDIGLLMMNALQGVIIKGKIQPAGARDVVGFNTWITTAVFGGTSSSFQTFWGEVQPDGSFEIKNLPEGDYQLVENQKIGYMREKIEPLKVTLEDGQTANVGTLRYFMDSEADGPFYISYEVDGVISLRKNRPALSFDGTKMNLQNAMLAGISAGQYSHKFNILLDKVTGPGTYICENTATSKIELSMLDAKLRGMGIWTSAAEGGSAVVTITSIDQVERIMNGTFEALLIANNDKASGTKIIKKGVFKNFKY